MVKKTANRGAWTAEEDQKLADYVKIHGDKKWKSLPLQAGLNRCGKSCRLRWLNYLRPGIKRGNISEDEEDLIIRLHNLLGNRWSLIAGRLPGRTDNEIKNHWNTHLCKKSLTIYQLNQKQNEKVVDTSCGKTLEFPKSSVSARLGDANWAAKVSNDLKGFENSYLASNQWDELLENDFDVDGFWDFSSDFDVLPSSTDDKNQFEWEGIYQNLMSLDSHGSSKGCLEGQIGHNLLDFDTFARLFEYDESDEVSCFY